MSKAAVQKTLPQMIEPRKFAAQAVLLEGQIPGDKLERLAEARASANAISVSLDFGYDEERRRVVTGSIKAEVLAECQRCLNPLAVTIEISVAWAIVWDEDKAKQLPSRLDPWIVEEETASLYAAIEEEILLALPVAPMHAESCINSDLLSSGDVAPAEEAHTKHNPFQALEALKGKTKH